MASKFNKNCIYTGVADSFCLSCQIYLKEHDINKHIESSEHKDTLKSVGYAEKYKDNLIWKVSQGFYCELCNVVIQTNVKVHIHVSDPTHINNKTKYLVKGHVNGITVFDKIFIETKAWNGLNNESCFICNIDLDNDENHKNDSKHILNLIQSKLELKEDKTVYRKIDGNLINCLICNIIVDLESKEAHIQTSEHLKEYLKCTENIKKIKFNRDIIENGVKTKCKSVVVKNEESTSSKSEIKEKPLKNDTCIAKVQDADEGNKTVLQPSESLRLAMDFAEQNHLQYKSTGTYCQVCNIRFSSSLEMMKEHVSEDDHKKNVEKPKVNITKKPMVGFIHRITDIKNILNHDVVINEEISISYLSFNMIGGSGGVWRCHACEVSIHLNQFEAHIETYKHKVFMLVTPVIAECNKNEFIREVRSGIFHCGYCNFIESSFDEMQNHLKSIQHAEMKSHCEILLNQYLAMIAIGREKT